MKTKHDIQTAADAEKQRLIKEGWTTLQSTKIRVSTKMTSSAGRALHWRDEIVISFAFFSNDENFDASLIEVVSHELAHIVLGHGAGHSQVWVDEHKKMGGTGERFHSLQLASGFARKEKVQVDCPICKKPMMLGPTQANKHLSGRARYTHPKCRQKRAMSLEMEALRRALGDAR